MEPSASPVRRKYHSPERCDPGELRRLVETAAAAYASLGDADGTPPPLADIAAQLDMSVPTVRRLLITAGVYHSPKADMIQRLRREGAAMEEIMARTGMTRTAIGTYLPYSQHAPQPLPELPDPATMPLAMQAALQDLRCHMDEETLWATLSIFAGETFRTLKGLDFTYVLRGNEMFVDRKDKSITRATIELAFRTARALGPEATGPKKLGCFGASYLYPIFIRLGIIPLAGGLEV